MVWGGYCRLQMPWQGAVGERDTAAGSQAMPAPPPPNSMNHCANEQKTKWTHTDGHQHPHWLLIASDKEAPYLGTSSHGILQATGGSQCHHSPFCRSPNNLHTYKWSQYNRQTSCCTRSRDLGVEPAKLFMIWNCVGRYTHKRVNLRP